MVGEGFPRIKALGGVGRFRQRLAELDLDLPCDDEVMAAPASPLAAPVPLGAGLMGRNRFAVQPMEGWDGEDDGRPSDLVRRRWRRFGAGGAGLVWGEAVAVAEGARANARQLLVTDELGSLRDDLVAAAAEAGLAAPVVGVQLTHSGRWSYREPRTARSDPEIEVRRAGSELSDDEVRSVIARFADAAGRVQAMGIDFVDLKHCHGYLMHEFLSARHRAGEFGGQSVEARMRVMVDLVAAVNAAAPGLPIAVRLSVVDVAPGVFGTDGVDDAIAVVRRLHADGVRLVNVTAGSPYYSPHVQRPAAFPAVDGYAPPEDPLCGVARLLHAAQAVKEAVPDMTVVSSGWSYLQEFLPHVAQACIREGWFDVVGLGRLSLPYPDFAVTVLAGRPVETDRLCRTFSDCTNAPRNGLVSGCYPLDPFYKDRPERAVLLRAKRAVRSGSG